MLAQKVSIIVPCYNQAQYLDEALNSVLNQTYDNWECIIVNDGSQDDTEEIAKKWLSIDNRFKYLYKENGGLSSARNHGLDNAKGDFVQFLDSDDFISRDKLELSLKELSATQNQDKQLVISNFKMFKNDIYNSSAPFCKFDSHFFNFYSVLYEWDDLFSIPIHCGFFKSSLFNNFRFPEKLKAKEDWVMWVYIFKENSKAIFVDLPLAFYRLNPDSMTQKKDMLIDYLNAYEYLKTIVSDHEHLVLSRNLISRYYKFNKLGRAKMTALKNSNTYRSGLMMKKILKKAKLLRISRYLFNVIFKK